MGTWSLTGNALGTPPSGFLGTTDNNALVIKTGSPTTERLRVDTSGNVGIGTPNPTSTLQVNGNVSVVKGNVSVTGAGFLTVSGLYNNPEGTQNFNWSVNSSGSPSSVLAVTASAPGALGPIITLTNTSGGAKAACAVDFYTFDPGEGVGPDHQTGPSSRIQALDDGNFANDIVFLSNTPGAPNNLLVERMRITSTGNVNVPGDVVLTGADCAEHFDVNSPEPPEPGTVLVIDEGGALTQSRDAYDKKVAGVVSGAGDYRHGILLDQRPGSEARVPVALVGKVYCKVDAQYSSIEVGDLLTTSTTPGHAMKAAEPLKAFGSVIGKALKPLRNGKGLIPILIALQ